MNSSGHRLWCYLHAFPGSSIALTRPWHCHQPAPQKHKALPLPPCNHGTRVNGGLNFEQDLPTKLWGSLFHTLVEVAVATWISCPEQVPMSSGKELCGAEPKKGPVQQGLGWPWLFQGQPCPHPGSCPCCHQADCATCLGAAALQHGETVALQDVAGGGGTEMDTTPLPSRADTYCTTTLLVFNTIAAATWPVPRAGHCTG